MFGQEEIKLPRPNEKIFDECVGWLLEDAYRSGVVLAELEVTPVSKSEIEEEIRHAFETGEWREWEIYTDWWEQTADCLLKAMGITDPEQIEEGMNWHGARVMAALQYEEWIDTPLVDAFIRYEQGIIDGYRKKGLLIE